MRGGRILSLGAALVVTGCVENTAPGNDREAGLDAPARPAEVSSAAAAIEGVDTRLLVPEIMTDADLANVPGVADACVFRMTRVGMPVLVYASQAVVKLNGRLMVLPAAGEGIGRYAADGVDVTVRPLDDERESRFDAEFVLRLPGALHEQGYHGSAEC